MQNLQDDDYGVTESQPCIAEMCRAGGCPRIPPAPPPIPDEVGPLEPDQATEIWNAVATLDAAVVRQVMATYPNNLFVNRERKAIQILGCNAAVIGSVYIGDSELLKLAEYRP
jgi:hypothetical protein